GSASSRPYGALQAEGGNVPGYEPIDIFHAGNAGVGDVDDAVEAGARIFRGLPFVVSERAIILRSGDASVSIDVARTVKHLIVAHRLLDSDLLAGGPLGVAVADYVLHLAGESVHEVAIRERFEIAAIPTSWGGL